MQYIVDAALAAIIVLNIATGLKKGLIKTVFGLAALIVSIIASYLFGSTVGTFLRTTKAYRDICDSTSERLVSYFEEAAEEGSGKALEELSDSAFVKQLENMGVDTQQKLDEYAKQTQSNAHLAAQSLAQSFAQPVLETLSNVVGTVLVFVACLIVCWIASAMLDGVFRLPFLRSVNSAGGLILGIILGVFYAFVACMIIKSLLPCIPKNPVLYVGMEKDTVLYGYLSEINPIYIFLLGRFWA